jgi:hypothetical protein
VAAKFDNHGHADLVAQVPTGGFLNDVVLFKGNGDGTFQAPTVIGTAVKDVYEYLAVDVNKDGNLDLIGAGRGTVWVQLGNGNGTFQPPVAYDFAGPGGSCDDACGIKVADFDGDGKLDIAVSGRDSFTGFAVLRGKGDGTFESPLRFAVGATGASWLDVGDVNGDGKPDIVIGHAGQNGNNYTILINTLPALVSAASRKVHGAAGTFNLPLSSIATNPTTEPRLGPGQTIVFTFDKPISSATATITEGTATAAAPTFSGNDVIVNLSGVTDQQYVTITLTNVASTDGGTGASGTVRVGFLAGDVNQNRVVTVADLGLVNAQLTQLVTATNFLKDVNASGTLTVADKGLVNANLTRSLPAP